MSSKTIQRNAMKAKDPIRSTRDRVRTFLTVFERIPKNEAEDTPRDLAQKTGHALGANLIIVGTVWKFKERVGGAIGVESPASVAFAIGLIDVADGRML
ncbi:MAG: hypothetical protein KJ823_03990, partial [Proteobacteria bacterium]|nr:hypothetical protein [Pseudomonadota bacterium]